MLVRMRTFGKRGRHHVGAYESIGLRFPLSCLCGDCAMAWC